jgi:hypothetical protein
LGLKVGLGLSLEVGFELGVRLRLGLGCFHMLPRVIFIDMLLC